MNEDEERLLWDYLHPDGGTTYRMTYPEPDPIFEDDEEGRDMRFAFGLVVGLSLGFTAAFYALSKLVVRSIAATLEETGFVAQSHGWIENPDSHMGRL